MIKQEFGLDPEMVIFGGILGFAGLFGLLMLVLKLIEPWEIERIRRKSEEFQKELNRKTPAERKRYLEELRARVSKHNQPDKGK